MSKRTRLNTKRSKSENTKLGASYSKAIAAFLGRHPVVALTVLYIWASTIGLIYHWRLFGHFGINLFDFAEANDFLLAAFKNPYGFLSVAISVLIGILIAILAALLPYLAAFLPNLSPKVRRSLRHELSPKDAWSISLFSVVVLFTFYVPWKTAAITAKSIRSADGDAFEIRLQRRPAENEQVLRGQILIGSTGKFMFFYKSQTSEVTAIPVSNVASLVLSK